MNNNERMILVRDCNRNIRKEWTNTWTTFSQSEISGFTYEEGYYYLLLVAVAEDQDYEELGGSSVTYSLLKVLEKTPSESIRTQ